MGKITAIEVERQAKRMDEQLLTFNLKMNEIIGELNLMSEIVSSNDSGLQNSLIDFSENYEKIRNKLNIGFNDLEGIMKSWASKTIQNETEMAQSVSTTSGELDDLSSRLSSIDFN